MKKLVLFLTAIFLLALSSCTRIDQMVYDNADKYLVGSQEYEGELTKLDVSWIVGEVNLVLDENATKVSVVENNNLDPERKVHTYFTNGTLYVKFWKSGLKTELNSVFEKKVTITYPSVTNLHVSVTSGKISSTKVVAKDVSFNLTSGNVTVDNLECDNFLQTGTSGTVYIKNIKAKTYYETFTSGVTDLSFLNVEDVKIKATSGQIYLALPEDGGKVAVKNTSGFVKSDREYKILDNVYIFGTSEVKYDVEFTSGLLYIK